MPIYEIENKATQEKIAVKANNKSQALNFITAEAFNVEPMKPEAIVEYMENGGTVQDATPSESHVEAPVTRSADVQAMDEEESLSAASADAATAANQ